MTMPDKATKVRVVCTQPFTTTLPLGPVASRFTGQQTLTRHYQRNESRTFNSLAAAVQFCLLSEGRAEIQPNHKELT